MSIRFIKTAFGAYFNVDCIQHFYCEGTGTKLMGEMNWSVRACSIFEGEMQDVLIECFKRKEDAEEYLDGLIHEINC